MFLVAVGISEHNIIDDLTSLHILHHNKSEVLFLEIDRTIEPRRVKPDFGVSDQARHKPGCTVTEDGKRLKISDLASRGILLSV